MDRLLKPTLLFSVILLGQLVIAVLFVSGAIPSFTLSADNLDLGGLAVYFLFSCTFLTMLGAFCRNDRSEEAVDTRITKNVNQPRLNACINLILVLSLFCCLYLLMLTRNDMSFPDYVMACVNNSIKTSSELASGPYHLILILPILNAVLIPLMDGKGLLSRFCANLICLLMLSTVFGTRILLLEALVFSGLIYASRHNFKLTFTLKQLSIGLMAAIIMFIFFAIISGYRDFEYEGRFYTDSPIVWGVSRLLDYPCSVLIYTSHYLDLASLPGNLLNLVPSFRRLGFLSDLFADGSHAWFLARYGMSYYTNIGCFTEICEGLGLWAAPLAILFAYVGARLYRGYCTRSLFGVMFYPFFFYSILEFWRVFHLGYELIQMTVVILLFIYFFIKPRANEEVARD